MNNQQEALKLSTVAIALFAGALGSVLTLAATQNLAVMDVPPAAVLEPLDAGNAESVRIDRPADEVVGVSIDTVASSAPDVGDIDWQLALDEAAAERSQLAATIVALTRQIGELEADVINLAALSALDGTDAHSDQTPENLHGIGEAGTARGRRNGALPEQRLDNLLAAGLDEQRARDLQSRNDQYQLARLELFDQAAREGWSDSEQLTDRLAELEDSRVNLRDELGDAAYDRYLYESGRSNRIGIASVISGSSADLSGLRVGDQLTGYAGTRLFQVSELQAATRDGVRGEYVQLDFERAGQAMNVQIPRGPLGVTLQATREQP